MSICAECSRVYDFLRGWRRQSRFVRFALSCSLAVPYPQTTGMSNRAPDTARITDLLLAVSNGERDALDQLVPVVYDHLRRIAGAQLRREIPGLSLQPTALVHEAYLRLVDQRQLHWRNRAHFFGVAASLMRRILVDHARARLAEKRGGGLERVTLHGDEAAATVQSPPGIDVLALHESLSRMAAFNPRQERIVELRYFGGLTIEEAAEVIGISEATLVREWTIAKAWLRVDLSDSRPKNTRT
jgi:RNA polymerase sigma-70 factor, ECF subfamily